MFKNFGTAIRSVAIAGVLALSAQAAAAVTYPTFVLNTANSDIDITLTQGCLGPLCSSTTLTAGFASGADSFSWTPTGPTDSIFVSDFIDWTAGGIGVGFFDVEVTLEFSSPDAATSSPGTGSGGFGTLFGVISGGVLSWNGPASVTFAQGSTLDIFFENNVVIGKGSTTTTGATVVGNEIAPIPLPAAGWALLAALGGLAALRRKTAV